MLKRIGSFGIACLLFLSANAAEHNKSFSARAWTVTRTVIWKTGGVVWYTGKGIVIGGCVGAVAGGSGGVLMLCDYHSGSLHCHRAAPFTGFAGSFAGGVTGALTGVAGFVQGMRRYSRGR